MAALRSLTALLLTLFVGGAGVQDTVLLCRSQQTTHRSCCCAHQQRLPALGDELSRAPCCDAAAVEAAAVPPSSGATPDFHLASPVRIEAAFAALAPSLLALALPVADEGVTALATGPPLHQRPHQLLI
ncbi:MAG: hypothetical protein HYS27_05285 [Deltaproteobacteria bacterium]|nr:hypothetical protein [Deltaproteobacteria bacterium]